MKYKRKAIFLSVPLTNGSLGAIMARNKQAVRRENPMKRSSRQEITRRTAYSGLLLATMLVLGYVESLLPAVAGVPGIKLGLSNSVLIFAVYMLNIPTAWTLMVLKVLLSGLLFGGFNTIMYAMAGGVLSMLFMSILSRFQSIHPIAVSMVGGVMHNVGQVAMAMILLHTQQLLYYMAILIFAGMACGALTGVCASSVMKHLKAMKK